MVTFDKSQNIFQIWSQHPLWALQSPRILPHLERPFQWRCKKRFCYFPPERFNLEIGTNKQSGGLEVWNSHKETVIGGWDHHIADISEYKRSTYPHAVKNQRMARNDSSRGRSYTTRSTNQSTVSRPMRVLHSANKIYSQAIVPDNRLRFSGRNLIDIELLLAAHPSGRSSKYDYISLTYLNKSYRKLTL